MIQVFLETLQSQKPEFFKSVSNSKKLNPAAFEQVGNQILKLLNPMGDRSVFEKLCRSYCAYTFEQNKMQMIYELSGAYPVSSYEEANERVYQNHSVMSEYMTSLLLTQFLWPHHLQIVRFFCDRFLALFDPRNSILAVEFAPGHGLFGRIFLENIFGARLKGYDISPAAIKMAVEFAVLEGLGDRAQYEARDVLSKNMRIAGGFKAIIAGELMEHLNNPNLLCESIAEQLAPDGYAFGAMQRLYNRGRYLPSSSSKILPSGVVPFLYSISTPSPCPLPQGRGMRPQRYW